MEEAKKLQKEPQVPKKGFFEKMRNHFAKK
jgi:hypothetical protein